MVELFSLFNDFFYLTIKILNARKLTYFWLLEVIMVGITQKSTGRDAFTQKSTGRGAFTQKSTGRGAFSKKARVAVLLGTTFPLFK